MTVIFPMISDNIEKIEDVMNIVPEALLRALDMESISSYEQFISAEYYGLFYTLGLLIGQDIWQRVFTARTPGVARLGGTAAGIYCILFGVAGAIIGMAAAILLPNIEVRDDVFASVALEVLPVGIGGIALAAGVAAMMSTASGGLIAAATVVQADVI